jgi:hypothetical protein
VAVDALAARVRDLYVLAGPDGGGKDARVVSDNGDSQYRVVVEATFDARHMADLEDVDDETFEELGRAVYARALEKVGR